LQYAEHLVGPGAALLERLTRRRPVLLIFSLDNSDVPWREWLALIKSAPATRRIPVLCFGVHMDVETKKEAIARGAQVVLARSRFVKELPSLIQQYAVVPDYATLEESCQEALSSLALQGLALFNRGQYFEAHELLEEAWKEDRTSGRELYRSILQLAVAYLQIERGNYNGALKMFLRMRQWIDPLPGSCRGVDVAGLRIDSEAVYEHLKSLGGERIAEFDRSRFQPVRYWSEP
jgi:predicted metal-dependent hydrolase